MDTRSTRRDRAPVPQDEGDTVDHADVVNQVGERVDENRTDPSAAPEGSNSTEVDVIVERVLEKMQELWQTQQESCMLGVRHMVSEIMQHEWPSQHQEHQQLPAGGLSQPNKLKPGRYDGNTEWESYHRQFELIAEHNGWNNFSKAAALSSVLSGTALEILTEVENPQSYLALTEALKKRFGIRHQAQRNLTLLYARVQQPKEDLQAYHQAIKSLARRAWPAEARGGAIEDNSLDEATDAWGIKVERVEIKDVRLPVQLQRAMAAEAEAAREARAKVIAAEGEQKASRALREASEVIGDSPAALQLRYLQTLNTISAEKNSTIVFPLPIDMLTYFMRAKDAVNNQ
ncbi:hypothetical protein GE061_004716 [Apolygus lucorum]|uniref:Band 7 domain-containing protein n=1 Tax=Apolygus lucorum TaxID=248454 RepID=A0A8S9X1S1_APOLU|nr:hypothetical protein GE061_004716 [Apolygus lucorum]